MSQLPLDWSFPTSYATHDFVVTESNQLATNLVTSWHTLPASDGLLLTGPEASGKTHLAHIWAEQNNAAFISLDQLHATDIDTLFASHKRLVLEAIEDAEAEPLFHLLQHCKLHRELAVLLTSRIELKTLWVNPADIHSRLCSLAHAHLNAPDDALLQALFAKSFSDRQLRVDSSVINYLIPRIPRDCASLYRIIARLDEAALEKKQAITLPLARRVLEEESEK